MWRRWRVSLTLGAGVPVVVLSGAVWTVLVPAAPGPRLLHTVAVGHAYTQDLAVDAASGHLYVPTQAGLAVLDSASGAVLGTVALPGQGWAEHVAVAARARRVFATDSFHTLSVFDTEGRLLRSLTIGSGALALAVDERAGHVFVYTASSPWQADTCGFGHVSMLDAASRRLLRTVSVGMPPGELPDEHTGCSVGGSSTRQGALAVDERTGRLFVASRIARGNEPTSVVSVLDTASGALLRTVQVGRQPKTVVVDAPTGRVFVTDGTGLSMLDARSGRLLRSYLVVAASGPLAVDGRTGHLFVPDTNGMIDTLDGSTGAVLHSLQIPYSPFALGVAPMAAAYDSRSSRLFVLRPGIVGTRQHPAPLAIPYGNRPSAPGSGAAGQEYLGTLWVVDMARGALLETVSVGKNPAALVLDARAGRAFVLNGGFGLWTAPRSGAAPLAESGWRRWLGWLPLLRGRSPAPIIEGSSISVIDATR